MDYATFRAGEHRTGQQHIRHPESLELGAYGRIIDRGLNRFERLNDLGSTGWQTGDTG